MMQIKLSSKGQLVIPKKIRRALDLKPGDEFNIELAGRQIILQPIVDKEKMLQAIKELHDLAKGSDLLDALEEDHRWELEKERRREQELFTR